MVRSFDAPGVPHDRNNDRYSDTDGDFRQRVRARRTQAPEASGFDPQRRATELAILDALRAVVDPEIGMNVVELALIKQIILGPDSTESEDDPDHPVLPLRRLDDRAGEGADRIGRGA